MNDIYVTAINDTNEYMVKNIKLKPGQEKFIETIEECLEEAKLDSQWRPVMIQSKENIVGFAMYGSFGPNKETWIDRIIIDRDFQGKGLGKKTMLKLIDIITKEYDVKEIYLSIIEGNEIAYNLYTTIGFVYTNEKDPNGERIFNYTIK